MDGKSFPLVANACLAAATLLLLLAPVVARVVEAILIVTDDGPTLAALVCAPVDGMVLGVLLPISNLSLTTSLELATHKKKRAGP